MMDVMELLYFKNAAIGGAVLLVLVAIAILKPYLDSFWNDVDERIERLWGDGGDGRRKERT
jgi:hypothetical protein